MVEFHEDLPACPECGANWDGGDILDDFKRLRADGVEYWKDRTDAQLVESAGRYGWTPETPERFSYLVGCEHSGYDGVSEWMCPSCKVRWDRWTGKKV